MTRASAPGAHHAGLIAAMGANAPSSASTSQLTPSDARPAPVKVTAPALTPAPAVHAFTTSPAPSSALATPTPTPLVSTGAAPPPHTGAPRMCLATLLHRSMALHVASPAPAPAAVVPSVHSGPMIVFSDMATFHRSNTALWLRLPFPTSRTATISVYAVGIVIIDGRKYRLQGWLSRITTLAYRHNTVLIHIEEPVLLVARLQSRGGRDLDWMEGEWNVGREGLLATGTWRLYAAVQEHSNVVHISAPTVAIRIRVDDDWELQHGRCVSLRALVAAAKNTRAVTAPATTRYLPDVPLGAQTAHAEYGEDNEPGATTPRPLARTPARHGAVGAIKTAAADGRPRAASVGAFPWPPDSDHPGWMPAESASGAARAGPRAVVAPASSSTPTKPAKTTMRPWRFEYLQTRWESAVPVIDGIHEDWCP
ncbi:hypothetical protein AMAG_09351 [Allomyces macrogynus ATCC 38327]|uniref:Uncharacterized protein n=1 Tax=Allomyces macrogynus (strain ATCC 38327) TaxID=578462 RepID=A0A0L0SPJ6_ALLM3|nr:hypothetical protein AMAG_09351 [Allomyces macrogynus ATCC 38327]|eukprot:KNE64324.1 hypothetical protein AMAG_09351 [Allomyces macrogynus ATCC 38327]